MRTIGSGKSAKDQGITSLEVSIKGHIFTENIYKLGSMKKETLKRIRTAKTVTFLASNTVRVNLQTPRGIAKIETTKTQLWQINENVISAYN